MTAPVDIALNLAIGSSVVIASRAAVAEERLHRSAALWALLSFELLIFLPLGSYLLWRYPEWSYMYLFEAGELSGRVWLVAASYLAAALCGYFVSRTLVRQSRPRVAMAFGGGCLVLTIAIMIFGHRQLLGYGTTAAFRADANGLPGISSSPLIWVLVPGILIILAAWGVMIWRLSLYGGAWRPAEFEAMAEVEVYEEEDLPAQPGTKKLS